VVQAEAVGSAELEDIGPFLTVREIAQKLRVSTATVYDLCDSGRLTHLRVNNAIRVSVPALRKFLRVRRRERASVQYD
jgi:excisionase family DNA binding protein